MEKNKKVILAFSGGLDTACILFWLKDKGYDVICYTADVGQECDFENVKEQAMKLGASKIFIDDRKKEFMNQFIYPSLAYGGIYQGKYLLGTSLTRPSITKGMIELARVEKVHCLSHGATGKGNDQVRFELVSMSLDPEIKCIAPWRIPEFYERFKGRQDLMNYAESHGFKVSATPKKPYSIDANMMHISFESGILEDPMNPFPEEISEYMSPRNLWPNEPQSMSIEFKLGIPIKVMDKSNNIEITDSLDIISYLNKWGGKHGIGRIDIVEDRFIGMKSRGIYETPGCTIIYQAIRDLEMLCLDQEVYKVRTYLANQFSELVYNGLWFSPECEYIRACLDLSRKTLNGVVHLELYKGQVYILGRKAEKSLYDRELVSMDEQGDFTPINAEGFIRTKGIRLRTFRHAHGKSPYTDKEWGTF